MKRIISVTCLLVLALSLGSVYAQEHLAEEEISPRGVRVDRINYNDSPINKLSRGAINTASCWLEVPAEVFRVSQEKDPLLGVTVGFAQGICTAAVRGVTGLFDAVTFAAPSYDKPILEPEYAHQSLDQAFQDYLW